MNENLWGLIEQGGVISKVLLLLSVGGTTIIIWKIIELVKAHYVYRRNLKRDSRHLIQLAKDVSLDQLIQDHCFFVSHRLEKGLSLVKIIYLIAPLLGLLGTVLGILQGFFTMAKEAGASPELFAEGIAMALVTTVFGLVVAIPHLIAYHGLMGSIRSLEGELEISLKEESLKKIMVRQKSNSVREKI